MICRVTTNLLSVFCLTAGSLWVTMSLANAQGAFLAQQVASAPAYNTQTTTTSVRGRANEPLGEPAPMPDADIYPPVPRLDDQKAAHVSPNLFRPKTQFRGDGYSPGSTAQESQERSLKPAPGISLKVPLD